MSRSIKVLAWISYVLSGIVLIVVATIAWMYFSQYSAVEDAVRARLKDPYSAKFRDLKAGNQGWVCGYVNAKNSMGGYTGDRHFIAGPAKVVDFEPQPSTSVNPGDVLKDLEAMKQYRELTSLACKTK